MALSIGVLRAAAIAAVLTVSFTGIAAAQNGTLTGTVTDTTGAPVASAEVRVEGTQLHATSDDQGRYELRNVPAGTQTLRVLLLGSKSTTRLVTVSAGASTEVNFTLERAPIPIAPVEVVVGSRAPHTAADELAVPVDVYEAEELARQGTTETSQVLQSLSPSINFPRQSVTDATDVVRPFTLRGLSPDHTLVLLNGWRRHPTALVNTFAYGTGAGSSGVDLNTIPASAIDHVEVLRDGASAQYGSDAIAGVVNLVTRRGRFEPFANVMAGRYQSTDYDNDGETFNASAGWGVGVGQGTLGLFAEVLDRQPTNRAWADPFDDSGGAPDVVSPDGKVITKNNPVTQPNQHWGDGLEKDVLTLANLRYPLDELGESRLYAFGGYSSRRGSGQGYRRYASDSRNWPQIYPLGFLPEFHPDVTDYSATGGWANDTGDWKFDIGASYGHNDFEYNLRNTLNASLGPSLTTPTAPGPDGIFGNNDDPGIPNQTEFFAGRMSRDEIVSGISASTTVNWGLPEPINLALGISHRHEMFKIEQGEVASWIDGGSLDQGGTNEATAGSQVFAGFSPADEADASRDNVGGYADLESKLSSQWLANVAVRGENYNDFGAVVSGKLALRYQPSQRLVFRGAVSNGFRAPGLGQIHFSKVITNVIGGNPIEVGVYPVDHPAAQLLGAKALKEETSVNFSAGLAATPQDGLTFTADYFDITINDRILLGATFDDATTLSILANAGYNNIGGVQYFTNGLDTKTRGVDLTADWRVKVGGDRTLGLNGVLNYTTNEITHVDPLPAVLQGSSEPGLLDVVTRLAIEKERPDWRYTLTGDFTTGRVHGLGRVAYFGKFSSAQPGYCDTCEESYGAKTLVDAEAGYRFDFIDWSIGARNLFDTYPDQPKLDFNNNFATFPWAAASPFGYNGRYLYTRASLSLKR